MADDSSVGSAPGSRGRMLLVEDNEVNQIVALGILGQLGYTVDMASDGEQALAMAESNAYLAVFMDCQMAEVDGFEVARRWRQLEREHHREAHTPMIAMTTSVRPGDRERCLAAGMDDYIAKPIRRDTVSTSLSRWLGTSIDREQIDELRVRPAAGRDAPLVGLVESFIADAPPLLDDLSGAVARGESAAIPPLAYSLKGLASALGVTGMTELAATIGAQGRNGDLSGATSTLGRLRAEFDRAAAELERIASQSR